MNNTTKRVLSFLLTLFVLCGCVDFPQVFALSVTKVPTYTKIQTMETNNGDVAEKFTVRTPLNEDSTIYVEGKVKTDVKRLCIRLKKHKTTAYATTTFVTPDENGEFSIQINTSFGNTMVPQVLDGKGTVVSATENYSTTPGYKAVERLSAGFYHLTIAKATTEKDADVSKGVEWWSGTLGGTKGYVLKDVLLVVEKGAENNPKLIRYNMVSTNQNATNSLEKNSTTISSYKGSYVRYTDEYLKDISYFLKNPSNDKTASSLTSAQVSYIRKVADKVTKGATTDYEKAQKIYEFVATNFYYDNLAHQKGINQYGHPYYNLYNRANKKKSKNSDASGRVGMVCFGYANMVLALARAEKIPARLIEGKHLTLFNNLWSELKVSEINQSSHWWPQLYIDGEWITVDANAGTMNAWDRSSFSAKGTYRYSGLVSYCGFDPSDEILGNAYFIQRICKGSTDGKYASNSGEVTRLKKFLNIKYKGITNGKRINKNYKQDNIATWTNGKKDNFGTDGFGRVYRISWANEGLYGKADFTNFKELNYLTVYNNDLTAITIDGCSSLTGLYASYNNLKTFDSTKAGSLTTINLKGNPLITAKVKANGKTVTLRSNYNACKFSFTKSGKKISVFAAKAPKGYQYLGVYDASGKRLTAKTEYTFTASAKYSKTYTVKFKKVK